MPPARGRGTLLDDPRSEASSSMASIKDRANSSLGVPRGRKGITHDSYSTTLKATVTNGTVAPGILASTTTVGADAPQTDWNAIPISFLQTYRGAYRLQTPSSYTQPNAETLYKSSRVGLRAPSMVLQRRKEKDLKWYRKKLGQSNNGVMSRTGRISRTKQPKDDTAAPAVVAAAAANGNGVTADSKAKQHQQNGTNDTSVAQSIEPSSPALNSITSEAPSTLLNAANPESTIIGRQSPSSLAMVVRKHFNAQQLHEPETIAHFTYVVKQQGYGAASSTAGGNALAAAVNNSNHNTLNTSVSASNSNRLSKPVRVEGCRGDGLGSIMGSMGREVKLGDTGGGAFRLRFRP